MRIKHLTLMAGPTGTFPIGHERDVADAEGRDLVAGNYAVEIKPRVPETATARPMETATAAEQEAAKNLAAIGKAAGAAKKAGKKSAPSAPAVVAPPAPEETAASVVAAEAGAPDETPAQLPAAE